MLLYLIYTGGLLALKKVFFLSGTSQVIKSLEKYIFSIQRARVKSPIQGLRGYKGNDKENS